MLQLSDFRSPTTSFLRKSVAAFGKDLHSVEGWPEWTKDT